MIQDLKHLRSIINRAPVASVEKIIVLSLISSYSKLKKFTDFCEFLNSSNLLGLSSENICAKQTIVQLYSFGVRQWMNGGANISVFPTLMNF